MGIGASVFLIAVGAILVFATDVDVAGLNLRVVGWILLVVGAIGLIAVLTIWTPRRRRAGEVVEQRRPPEDPPAPL